MYRFNRALEEAKGEIQLWCDDERVRIAWLHTLPIWDAAYAKSLPPPCPPFINYQGALTEPGCRLERMSERLLDGGQAVGEGDVWDYGWAAEDCPSTSFHALIAEAAAGVLDLAPLPSPLPSLPPLRPFGPPTTRFPLPVTPAPTPRLPFDYPDYPVGQERGWHLGREDGLFFQALPEDFPEDFPVLGGKSKSEPSSTLLAPPSPDLTTVRSPCDDHRPKWGIVSQERTPRRRRLTTSTTPTMTATTPPSNATETPSCHPSVVPGKRPHLVSIIFLRRSLVK